MAGPADSIRRPPPSKAGAPTNRTGAAFRSTRAMPAEPFIPLVRAKALERLPNLLESLGVRFEDVLQRVGLPNVPLDREDGFLPFRDALAVVEDAARRTGLEHLSLQLAVAGGFDALGDYGRYITHAPTLQNAIIRAAQFVSWHSLATRLSLSREDSTRRAAAIVWRYHLSPLIRDDRHHASLFALVIMRNVVRLAAGSGWTPDELRLEARPAADRHALIEAFGERV